MTDHTATEPRPGDAGYYELHCHLDGSVRLQTIGELAAAAGITLPDSPAALAVAPRDVGSLHGFLPYIDVALDVLQTFDALRRAAKELVEDWQSDGVAYGEMRFAPQLHTRGDLTLDDAVRAVAAGAAAGTRATGVRAALLLCCLRHEDPDAGLAVAEAALRNRAVVAGIDLAGDERIPGVRHREAFETAAAAGLPITVHAGEAAGPDSVWEALDVLGALRIGHGVRSITDNALLDRLRTDKIALETCGLDPVRWTRGHAA